LCAGQTPLQFAHKSLQSPCIARTNTLQETHSIDVRWSETESEGPFTRCIRCASLSLHVAARDLASSVTGSAAAFRPPLRLAPCKFAQKSRDACHLVFCFSLLPHIPV
jgi:hypothetical protein